MFGIEATQEIVEFDSADEVVGYEDYKLIAIPKNITATTIKKRLNKLVDDMKSELKPTAEQTAKYSIAQTKVDVESLKSCLMAYDLKQKGTDVLEIGLQVKWISGAEVQVAPQETEISSYIVGGTKQDVSDTSFTGFSL